MTLLTRTQHAYLDLVMVLVFAFAPVVLGLGTAAAGLSYVLAGVHLLMTLLTADLPLVPGRLIPLALHGLVEVAAGVIIGLVGWLVFDDVDQVFFLVMAVAILLVFAVTPYLDQASR